MKNIAIIGLGWLGEQLGRHLNERNNNVIYGTTTTTDKCTRLNDKFERVINYCLGDSLDNLHASFHSVDCFVLTIPPSSHGGSYGQKIIQFIEDIEKLYPKAGFIYISSTSVYGNQSEEVDETTKVKPIKSNAKQIVQIENHLYSKYKEKTIIIRLGGLCGLKRHPVKYLTGKNDLKKPNAPVNLVHVEDVCYFLEALIETKFRVGIYNLCSTSHPSRIKYYQWAAQQLKLEKPRFDDKDISLDKTVICNSMFKLDFELKYKSPYDYPELLRK